MIDIFVCNRRVFADPNIRNVIDEHDIANLARDFKSINSNADSYISKSELIEFLKEDRSPDEMDSFWDECDPNGNYECTFVEYVHARGWFDQHGEEYHQNEWDERRVEGSGSVFESVHEYEAEQDEQGNAKGETEIATETAEGGGGGAGGAAGAAGAAGVARAVTPLQTDRNCRPSSSLASVCMESPALFGSKQEDLDSLEDFNALDFGHAGHM
jgi:hypothetical protein